MHHPEQLHAPFPFHTQFVPFFSNSDQAISQPFVDQSPENQAQPAEFDSFFADPNQASPEQFESFSAHPKQALPANFVPHFPDQNQAFFESLFPDTSATTLEPHQAPAADDLDAMLNFPDHFFTNANTEYREESDVSRPTAIAAFNAVVDPFEPATPPPARRPRPRKPKATPRTRTRPAARPSGFVPSDPDDLSSHEKKRLYVECLEHYVQYLHQLFAWIQVQPVPLERVSSYRSLTSRSLRTILIHLGKSSDILHGQIVHEEETLKGLQIRETLALMSQSYIAPDSPASDSTGTSSTYVSSNPDADIDDMAKFAYP
ncbi:hypothetical protein C8R47DRAFT_206521 [Mycena vitilis]|nr:hypothetical protein C8R47DRAFT_206521 [Mycena vitilis]